jgi:deferrochelatase/peroxidase EfeB
MAKSKLKEAAAIKLDLDQIQGDVLIGLQKNFQRFVFFAINDVPAFKATLGTSLAKRITTSKRVLEREHELQNLKKHGSNEVLPLVGVNVAFTSSGIALLVPGVDKTLGDPSFASPAAVRAKAAADVVDATGAPGWDAPFAQDSVHGVFFVTGGTQAAVDTEAAAITGLFGPAITVLVDDLANVRPGAEAGHEHFGWKDGISQPAVDGLNDPLPGQEVVEPGTFVFGYGSTPAPAALPWMRNGSFMVPSPRSARSRIRRVPRK